MADDVLSKLDSINGDIILFSIQNSFYYIICLQDDNKYVEFEISVDSMCNITSFNKIDHLEELGLLQSKKIISRKQKKRLVQLLIEKQMIISFFNQSNYTSKLVTELDYSDSTTMQGLPSYYVMLDKNRKIIGEYCLPFSVSPCPIDPMLWVYLARAITPYIK